MSFSNPFNNNNNNNNQNNPFGNNNNNFNNQNNQNNPFGNNNNNFNNNNNQNNPFGNNNNNTFNNNNNQNNQNNPFNNNNNQNNQNNPFNNQNNNQNNNNNFQSPYIFNNCGMNQNQFNVGYNNQAFNNPYFNQIYYVNGVPHNVNGTVLIKTFPKKELSPENVLKQMKVKDINIPELNEFVKNIQEEINKNNNYIKYLQKHVAELKEYGEAMNKQAINTTRIHKVLGDKGEKIEYLTKHIINEIQVINENLQIEVDNFRSMEGYNDNSLTLTVPSDFLLTLIEKTKERMDIYIRQIEDLQTLMKLFNSETNGSFCMNSDLIEELLNEMFKNAKLLLISESTYTDYTNKVQNSFAELLRIYGYKDEQIKSRFEFYKKHGEKNKM